MQSANWSLVKSHALMERRLHSNAFSALNRGVKLPQISDLHWRFWLAAGPVPMDRGGPAITSHMNADPFTLPGNPDSHVI
jgi:hypothetical protein